MSTTYYISGKGSDRNNGLTTNTAFRTLQRAADRTQPGDVVMVLNGTYSNPEPTQNILTITTSGTPDRWITYQAFPGHRPKLKSRNWHGISVEGAAYIVIDGFEIQGNRRQVRLEEAIAQQNNLNNPLTSGNGIGVSPGQTKTGETTYPHHVIIRNNTVYDASGGGIYTVNADRIIIEGNTVYNNASYSPYANSGISIYQSRNWESSGTGSGDTSGHALGKSEDFAEYQMIIRDNVAYRNQNLIPFFAVGFITDGNGIIVDDHRHTQNSPLEPYRGRTLIEHNLVYENGGRGIHVFESDRVDVIHNTAYQNSQHPDIGDGEITAIAAADLSFYNNILYGIPSQSLNTLINTQQVRFEGNLLFNSDCFTASTVTNVVGQNPQFVAPELYDFRLRSTSPAVELNGGAIRYEETHKVGTNRRDRLRGQKAADILEGLGGADRLLGLGGNDVLLGGGKRDQLFGGSGRDVLYGDAGKDHLRGHSGVDWLVGGAGSDRLRGGTQADYFVVQPGAGIDRILDFGVGRDRLVLPSSLVLEDLKRIERQRGVLLKVGTDKLAWILGVTADDVADVVFSRVP